MSIHKQPQPTVRAWQHAIDHDRVLLAWPDGTTMVVNSGRYIEDEPKVESPDAWVPIGKPPFAHGGVVRGGATAHDLGPLTLAGSQRQAASDAPRWSATVI